MIHFVRIQNVDDVYFQDMYHLYRDAFPANERRSWSGLCSELENSGRFFVNALVLDNEFVGFLNYWEFDLFIYIEHFAIVPRFRSQKIGSEALEDFMLKVTKPVVLEVEMPDDHDQKKRISFYENHQFLILPHYYAQPPYEGSGFLTPMLIMSSEFIDNEKFEIIRKTLYHDVYHFYQDD